VHVDLHVTVGVLDGLDDVVGGLRLEQRGHVFQGDRIGAHVKQLAGQLHVTLHGVDRGDGVADGALRVLANLLHGSHGVFKVARIVHGVEDAENVHAGLSRLVDEAIDHFVLVVAVAEQVLATQQHLQATVRQQLAEGPQALPRILIQETDTTVIGRSAPTLD